uniref:Ribosomal protein L30 ferredoxin-like fold domain-containing protein n=1 Tax=Pseudo-nitzschia australis TaxID=44445 RepID=A0A7S4A8K0_9STRA|mmetsp:Transcript_1053/g.2448  ORF Transcript_1053/g.2448 Transcript_1053/m.2448 type:complete len:282 (+) Transcript_1053:177-1022(+)
MAPIKDEHKDLALVPESVLKKRHDLDDLRRKRAAQEEKKSSNRKGSYVRKPATFLAKAKQRRNEQIRYRRVKKKGMQKKASKKIEIKTKEITLAGNNSDSEDEEQTQVIQYKANSVGSPYVFVIRIREDAGHPPRCVLNILLQLSLKEPNTGVFVRYNEITKRHLHLVEPWIVYGKPSDGLVGDLMERKSFGTVKGEKVPLSDNTIIENALGNEHGMICMEDLVHELTTVGEAFDAVAGFLRPFPLSATRSRFEKNLLSVKQGKDYGDQGEEIDEYIKQML